MLLRITYTYLDHFIEQKCAKVLIEPIQYKLWTEQQKNVIDLDKLEFFPAFTEAVSRSRTSLNQSGKTFVRRLNSDQRLGKDERDLGSAHRRR